VRRRGLALMEVVVASLVSAIIVGAISTAYGFAVHHELNFEKPRQDFESVAFFEDRIRNLLSKAVFTDNAEQSTFFVGDSVSGSSSYADRLMFTIAGMRPNGTIVDSSETDFGTRNQSFGPVGGVTEVELSTTPVGESGNLQGLFIRKQTPADNVQDSGGYESLLSDQVSEVGFEFWDSVDWLPTWDSTSDGRLPTAVRVHYYLTSEPDQEHIFVVRIPNAQGSADAQNGGQGGLGQ
jgi:hypothetical protein